MLGFTVSILQFLDVQEGISVTGNETINGAACAAASSHGIVLRSEMLVDWNEVLWLVLTIPEVHDWHTSQGPQTFFAPATDDSIIILV